MKIDNSINLLSLNQVKIPKKSKDDDIELKKATDKFEAIFVKQFLDLTLKPEYGTMPKGVGSDIHTSMYTRAVSESLSGVFGISDMLFKHLKDGK
jgi:Rod binding domain-containing protein